MDLKDKRIYIAGSTGMVGRAIVRALEGRGCGRLITKTSAELDLISQAEVEEFFTSERPEIVILSAAKVGGIHANDTLRAEFLYNNLMIEANVIHAAHQAGVEKLIFMGSSCIYPRMAQQPMREEALLTGPLEQTNEPYAIAKIAGLKMCESYYRQYGSNFYSVMPTNLFGPNDNFDLNSSHVIPALIRKVHSAKMENLPEVVVWGTGKPFREFMYVDDAADAVLFLLENIDAADLNNDGVSHVNIGCGKDVSILELVEIIKEVVGYNGSIRFDTSMPDGTPKKLLDASRLSKLGWNYRTSLVDGLRKTYDWFLSSRQTESSVAK
ncbi:GDP-L-fucose synthase [soil metagenome]